MVLKTKLEITVNKAAIPKKNTVYYKYEID
jgi:hypothetical protein